MSKNHISNSVTGMWVRSSTTMELTGFLEWVMHETEFQKWFFGHSDLCETSPRMGVRDVDEYHRFAEYGDPHTPAAFCKVTRLS